jgi:hypothetical protein
MALEPVDLRLDVAAGRGLDGAVEAALSLGPMNARLKDSRPKARLGAVAALIAKDERMIRTGRQYLESLPDGRQVYVKDSLADQTALQVIEERLAAPAQNLEEVADGFIAQHGG